MFSKLKYAKTRKFGQQNIIMYFHRSVHKAKIASAYKPHEVEKRETCDETIVNKECNVKNRPKFSIILPPPNVTGHLHLGHALMCTIQDVICRKKRLQGYDVTWVPGTDHAGIATQVVVERKLLKERGQSRYNIGRNEFLREVWKWKNEKGNSIVNDLKKLGATLSWDREYFTMNPIQSNAVTEAFISLFNEGLITREKSLVNWSCSLESTISDIEIKNMDINGPTTISIPNYEKPIKFGQIFYIGYKVANEDVDDEVIVATTRPETILGDIAVAIHPEDEKYNRFHSRNVNLWHPFRNETIPIIFDKSVDRDFGTGAVKITPAHDKNDFEMAQRHSLKTIQVIDEKGKIMIDIEGIFGLPRFIAREKILNVLAELNLLRDIKSHRMQLPICTRSEDVIEFMLRPQWFLDCHEMSNVAMAAVRTGQINIYPSNFENEWFRWLNECKKWCISRQLWWGHQIPAYFCNFNNKSIWIAAKSEEEAFIKAKQKFHTSQDNITVEQDVDVLDTWFSSSLLPFSAFNWPNKEYRQFYPLDLMETGHDILFFWVARMAMIGIKLTKEVPFKNILLHGIVCDSHGRKMSKSLGNIILPDQVIEGSSFDDLKNEIEKSYENGAITINELKKSIESLKKDFPNGLQACGIDALRFTLCSHNIKNHFINFDISECYTNRIFFNKIWQATKYTIGSCERLNINIKDCSLLNNINELSLMDKWILSKLCNMREICNQSMENYNFHIAISAIKTFFYSNFCDVYLETTKKEIKQASKVGNNHCVVLSTCLNLGLQVMMPFTPFLARELLQHFTEIEEFNNATFINLDLEQEVDIILEICTNIRQFKSQNQITGKHEPKIHIFPFNNNALELLKIYKDIIQTLALSREVIFEEDVNKRKFELLSTARHLCSFGISTNADYVKVNDSKDLNFKKLQKLEESLLRLKNVISKEGYKKGASLQIQNKHQERIKQIEIEINAIKSMHS